MIEWFKNGSSHAQSEILTSLNPTLLHACRITTCTQLKLIRIHIHMPKMVCLAQVWQNI